MSANSGATRQELADAEKRVGDVITQVKADLEKARKAAQHLAIAFTVHRRLFRGAGCDGRRRTSRWNLGHEGPAPLTRPQKRKERTMPILLWLLGIPIPLIILIMLLHH